MNLYTELDKFYSINKRSVSIADNEHLFIAPTCELLKQKNIVKSPLISKGKVSSFLQRFNDFNTSNMRFSVVREYRYKLPDSTSGHNKVGRKFGWVLYQAGACKLKFDASGSEVALDVDNLYLCFHKQKNTWLLKSTNADVQDYCLEVYADAVIQNGWQLLHPNGAVSIFNNKGYQLRFTNSKTNNETVIEYDYDDNGNLRSAKNNRGGQVTFVYDVYGRPISFNNRKGDITHYKYDVKKRLVAVIKKLNNTDVNIDKEHYYYENKNHPHLLTSVVKNDVLIFQCSYNKEINKVLISK